MLHSHRQRGTQQITKTFEIIDTKLNNIFLTKINQHEAHKRVNLLNSCGIVRYKARAI
ncbi:hypothetical protein [Methylobacterium sp. CM6246]